MRGPFAAVVILVGSSTACGVRTSLLDDLGEAAPYEDAAAPTPDAAASTPDATASSGADGEGASDAGDSADVALPATDLGDIFLTSGGVYADASVEALVAEAQFFPSVAATGCVVSAVAGCTFETCPTAVEGPGAFASAGAITVTGGGFPLELDQTDGGEYAPLPNGGSATALWVGGEALTVSAAGDTVPSFVEEVAAPTQLTVLTPMPPILSRAAPFAFSWLGASAGQVTVDVSEPGGATGSFLECQFDVATGTGTVPREALSQLPPGTVLLTVSTVTLTTVSPGPWLVRTFLQTNAADPTGLEYSGDVSLE
jgi:hypothetical protein